MTVGDLVTCDIGDLVNVIQLAKARYMCMYCAT